MIQRIQTVYLALAALGLIITLFVGSVWEDPAADELSWFRPLVLALGPLAIAGCVVSIFSFSQREQQLRIVVATQYGIILYLAVILLGGYIIGAPIVYDVQQQLDLGGVSTVVLPALAYVFLRMARSSILRDIALLKSADRIR